MESRFQAIHAGLQVALEEIGTRYKDIGSRLFCRKDGLIINAAVHFDVKGQTLGFRVGQWLGRCGLLTIGWKGLGGRAQFE